MSLRTTWRFQYVGKDLLASAEAMEAYHRQHADHWATEKLRLEQEIREKGIRLSELQVTGGAQFRADVDQALSGEYATATSRERDHRLQADGYLNYVHAFRLNPSAELALDVDDIAYFRIGLDVPTEPAQ